MALLRACDIPCRVHGFTIDKKLQKGAMTGLVIKEHLRMSFIAGLRFTSKEPGTNWRHLY